MLRMRSIASSSKQPTCTPAMIDHHAHRRFQSAERATMAPDQEISAPPISDELAGSPLVRFEPP
jgi:hypothetical protein